MREGLRSSTVSQRKRERSDSRRGVKPASDAGLAGECNGVRNILPDLNAEVNPSEFESDWLCEGGFPGDGGECEGTLAENGVADESIKSKGVDTEGNGEVGKDSVGSCLEKTEQSERGVDGELRGLGAKTVDLNVEALDCDDLVGYDLRNGEQIVVEKDGVGAVDGILEKKLGGDADISACSEQCGLAEDKVDRVSADGDVGDDRSDPQSRPVLLGCGSENVMCSMDSLGDRVEASSQKRNVPESEKVQPVCKVLRSRVVGSNGSLENITCSVDNLGDRLETISQNRDVAEKDKLQVDGKVLRSRVVVAVTTEGHSSGSSKRKKATGCQVSETEVTRNGESNEDLDGENKKHKSIPGIQIEEEDSALKSVLHGEEAFAEEVKNDESNEFFDAEETFAEEVRNDESNEVCDGQSQRDNGCCERSTEKVENTDPLSNTFDKAEAVGEVVNYGISKELALESNRKPKVGRGRGRPRKHVDNVSIDPLLKNIADSSQDRVKIKQVENNHLADYTVGQQKGSTERPEKRKRGRPRKLDKEIAGEKLIQHDREGSSRVGKRVKKQSSRQFFGKDPNGNKLNKFGNGNLNKRKRGRPRKSDKEHDAKEPVQPDQEVIDKGVVVVRNEDSQRSVEGSVRRVRKQTVDGTQAEAKPSASGAASPSSSLRLKRKRENAEEEPSKYESNLKVTGSSSREEKNMVRQQIVEMLKSAGWTVEYKPRQGRVYADAVYRSPEGRAHWSVTLAYRVLKHQVETGKAANFCFTPIPDEKLSTLFRVTMKERSDKNKSKPKKSSLVQSSGKCKGRKKGEHTSGGEENIAGSLSKKKSSSARSAKQNRRCCALLVRGSGHGSNSAAQEFMSVSGKHSILSWMIGCGVIAPGGKVHYRRRATVLKEGSVTKDGIHCSCCSELHSAAQFEAHADSRPHPMYQNMYLDNGLSMLQCQIELWSKQEEPIRLGFHKVNADEDDPNDDTCGICGDGGNLICCDGCPSTFHQSCLNILKFPSGDWHCVYCSCKYCGTAAVGEDQGNEKHDKLPYLLTCWLCDAKYHRLCAHEKDCENDQFSGSAFCGKSCEKIYERFQRLVGLRAEVGDGYTCTLIKRPDSCPRSSHGSDALVESKEIEDRSKLAVALSIMDECFLPIIDHRSGINLMRNTLYSCGSNFKRLNFRGFFTAILEKEDEVIAAACVRIHGKELAEMPFIGTRNAYRRQGMCRRLLSGVEMALRSLAVEKLVIPAVSEVAETWTSVFGFEPLGGLDSEMRHMNIIAFPGVDMLQKPLLNQQFVGDTISDREEKAIKSADPCTEKHTQENGLIEMKAVDGCPSEKVSSESGSRVPLESASVDQEEGSKPETVHSDTVHSTAENNPLSPSKDENFPVGTSDQVALSSGEPLLEAELSLAEHDAYQGIEKISMSTNCSKLEVDFANPLENGVEDRNNDNHPDEEINDLTCHVFHEVTEQSSATDGGLLLVTDGSIPNGAQANANIPEDFDSNLQIDCKVVAQFNLEKSCNMDSTSNDLGTPVKFYACSAPEVGSK